MDIVTYALLNEKIKDYASNVDEWLEENVDPDTGYVLDRSLQMENAAAPADMVGDINDEVGDLKNTLNHKADVIYDTASGDIASFPDGADGLPVKDLTVAIKPVQDTSGGDPSPTHICPISGWTGAKVMRVGKNFLPTTLETLKTLNNTGTWSGNTYTQNGVSFTVLTNGDENVIGIRANGTASDQAVFIIANTNYLTIPAGTWKFGIPLSDLSGQSAMRYRFNYNGHWFSVMDTVATVTLSENTASASADIAIASGATANNIVFYPMICREADYDGIFAPYIGGIYHITFPQEAETVYGGTLDVTSGVLTVDRASVDLGTLAWSTPYGTNDPNKYRMRSNDIVGIVKNQTATNIPANTICSTFKSISADATYSRTEGIAIGPTGIIIVYDSRYDTSSSASDFKSAMSGVQLVYELAQPQTYQLTPQEVTTLLGQNNVWSDTGSSTVEYPADTKLYIDKKLAALVAALS